jgi:hypothetical protein
MDEPDGSGLDLRILLTGTLNGALMKVKWLVSAVAATAMMAVPAFSQVGIYIGQAPPPVRYEVVTRSPGEGYSWIGGYWGYNGGRYTWVQGRWEKQPYAGAYWSHPHYDHYKQGWQIHEGHWDHEDHGDQHDDHHGNGH